jgi:hypothetical protein
MAPIITGDMTPGMIGTIRNIGIAEAVISEIIVLKLQWNRKMEIHHNANTFLIT